MYEKDKLHMVFYIDVSGISDFDVPAYVSEIANTFKSADDSVVKYFIPTTSGETRIEVLPTFKQFVPQEDLDDILTEELTPHFDEIKKRVLERLYAKDEKKLDSNCI